MSEHRVVDLKCGCKSIQTNGPGEGYASIYFCPTHEAAADLLGLLQKHLDWFDGKFLPVDETAFAEATRAAITKARGGK